MTRAHCLQIIAALRAIGTARAPNAKTVFTSQTLIVKFFSQMVPHARLVLPVILRFVVVASAAVQKENLMAVQSVTAMAIASHARRDIRKPTLRALRLSSNLTVHLVTPTVSAHQACARAPTVVDQWVEAQRAQNVIRTALAQCAKTIRIWAKKAFSDAVFIDDLDRKKSDACLVSMISSMMVWAKNSQTAAHMQTMASATNQTTAVLAQIPAIAAAAVANTVLGETVVQPVLCLLFQGAQNVILIRQAIPAQKVALSIRTTLDQVLFVLTVLLGGQPLGWEKQTQVQIVCTNSTLLRHVPIRSSLSSHTAATRALRIHTCVKWLIMHHRQNMPRKSARNTKVACGIPAGTWVRGTSKTVLVTRAR
jgi:hypothetical protein